MKEVITSLVALPLGLSILLLLLPIKKEKILSWVLLCSNITFGALTVALVVLYVMSGFKEQEFTLLTISQVDDFSFELSFFIDRYSVAFQFLIGFLSGLIFMFSRRYMHREPGYRRFFVTLLLFVAGISTVAMSNSIQVLFAGWELVGLSSFLLIGFYQNRKDSGRHALRTFSIYRFCDVGLFIGAWLFHDLGENITFFDFSQQKIDPAIFTQHHVIFTIIGLLIVFAAMGKSGQYPFTFWVPRAMKGPTPSSAIFYGALSIHAGVFLLIRMYPLWFHLNSIRWLVGIVGFVTMVTASLSAKTQANIKGQIGYASVAQTGIMFVELALGHRDVALFHFAGNAILRCYQLLASPSVLVIFLRLQNEGALLSTGVTGFMSRFLSPRVKQWLFAVSFSECYSEAIMNFLVRQLKAVARLAGKAISYQFTIFILVMLLVFVVLGGQLVDSRFTTVVRFIMGGLAVYLALAAFAERTSPLRVLNNAALSSFITGISLLFLIPEQFQHTQLFFIGIGAGYLLARSAFWLLPNKLLSLNYAGLGSLAPVKTNILLIGILFLSGFSLTPTFLGEDLLLHYGAKDHLFETFVIAGIFILNGVTLMRMYVKLTYGWDGTSPPVAN